MFEKVRSVIEAANTELSLHLAPADMDALAERLSASANEEEISNPTKCQENTGRTWRFENRRSGYIHVQIDCASGLQTEIAHCDKMRSLINNRGVTWMIVPPSESE